MTRTGRVLAVATYNHMRSKAADELSRLEAEARERGKGIWRNSPEVPVWLWNYR